MTFEELAEFMVDKVGFGIPDGCVVMSEPLHTATQAFTVAGFLLTTLPKETSLAGAFYSEGRKTISRMAQLGLIESEVEEFLDQSHGDVRRCLEQGFESNDYTDAAREIDKISARIEVVRELKMIKCVMDYLAKEVPDA